ncbi:beta-1,6-N-acetylglucosaminyltransferase [Paenibacillus sp. MBLB2552]|uniref:Peptide O-xylosyltransferase n=1 Tax=Paenibacillus mellifer TaxID=2937794 RepID=A0A9X2BT27_9BACL|nr:beta-1,6-N-acetylglucosaminyltransferase [Paenibacillus mellifer]MCK8489050.1 beta-1,6-N-acetylglucosaminyltransferase [Paenibacillus mellifer]
MKIAYFIMAHQKPNMLLRLLNAIYSAENIYLIHIDSGANDELLELAENLTRSNDNIRTLPSRFLSWGGWSLVQAELDAINYLLNWDQEWEYYINLSGQDFPLVKQEQVRDFLAGKDLNYIDARLMSEIPNQKQVTQGHYHIEDGGKLLNLGERKPFESYFQPQVKPYYGSQWKMITRAFAEYAATSYLSFEMQDYFRYTLIPDEAFFQTLLLNSQFKATHINKCYRYFDMELHHSAIQRPATLTVAYLTYLFSSDALFARKFDEDVDSVALQIIEKALDL